MADINDNEQFSLPRGTRKQDIAELYDRETYVLSRILECESPVLLAELVPSTKETPKYYDFLVSLSQQAAKLGVAELSRLASRRAESFKESWPLNNPSTSNSLFPEIVRPRMIGMLLVGERPKRITKSELWRATELMLDLPWDGTDILRFVEDHADLDDEELRNLRIEKLKTGLDSDQPGKPLDLAYRTFDFMMGKLDSKRAPSSILQTCTRAITKKGLAIYLLRACDTDLLSHCQKAYAHVETSGTSTDESILLPGNRLIKLLCVGPQYRLDYLGQLIRVLEALSEKRKRHEENSKLMESAVALREMDELLSINRACMILENYRPILENLSRCLDPESFWFIIQTSIEKLDVSLSQALEYLARKADNGGSAAIDYCVSLARLLAYIIERHQKEVNEKDLEKLAINMYLSLVITHMQSTQNPQLGGFLEANMTFLQNNQEWQFLHTLSQDYARRSETATLGPLFEMLHKANAIIQERNHG